jgi:endo-1,4-beta-xylanase
VIVSRRVLLAQMAAGSVAGLRPSILSDSDRGLRGLRDIAARRGVLYGSATATYELKDPAFAAALAREAAIIVAEYEMKRSDIETAPGVYDFSACDALLRYAHAYNMVFRGHTLVWHAKNPAWMEDALSQPNAERQLTDYITAVMCRYRGRLHSWDVVNEAIKPEDGRADNMRNTIWLKRFGPSYIDIAYHAARAADPDALLVYNDWGCELGAPANDRFRAATLNFLQGALARGVPIQALGMQGHLFAYGAQVDQRKLANFLGEIRGMGLKILVTEHDVDDSGGPLDTAQRDTTVADTSRRFLDVMLAEPSLTAVLTWGLSDKFLDKPGWRDQLIGRYPRMLPLDSDYRRKPMWAAMARAFG